MKYITQATLAFLLFIFYACSDGSKQNDQPELILTPQQSGTEALLIGISAASEDVVWISGTQSTVLLTTDGGNSWLSRNVPGDSLQFRDVYAVSKDTAYVLSIGKGSESRIYKTTNGGNTWTLQFKSSIPDAFFDCMAFWNPQTGIAFSDAVNGEFIIIKTTNGGQTWQRISSERLPAAQPGEGSFAASGTCVVTKGDSTAWIGTGNAARPRVLHTSDRGQTWQAFNLPLDAGAGAGTASLIFRDMQRGLALGGDITAPVTTDSSAAITNDGGVTWQLVQSPPLNSAVYGAAYVPGTHNVIAVGPGGISFSINEGMAWTHVDTTETWSVSFANSQNGWLTGPNGRIIHVNVK